MSLNLSKSLKIGFSISLIFYGHYDDLDISRISYGFNHWKERLGKFDEKSIDFFIVLMLLGCQYNVKFC
jgi:hypothetical protein